MNRLSPASLKRRIDAALGKIPCDGVIRNCSFLDVFSGKWLLGDVAWIDGVIVRTEPSGKATREFDGRGKYLVPGFIDAHVHVESSALVPREFEKATLARGTTTAICDPHELANVAGVEGIRYFLDWASVLNLDLRVMLSSCVPATDFETNGGGTISASELSLLRGHPKALGLAEMMNFPGVLAGDESVLNKISAFSDRMIDGHCPELRGAALSAYASVGISSCHESTSLAEAQEKLSKGIAVWIREGSVAKDLRVLTPLIDPFSSACIGFCTDDRNPLDIAHEGHVDHLVRSAIAVGAPPESVYRASSWSVARHYGLRGLGAVAPGYRADLVLLEDFRACSIKRVFSAGRPVDELPSSASEEGSRRFFNSVQIGTIELEDLKPVEGNVHVITVEPGQILTGRQVMASDAEGVSVLTVVERYGNFRKPANAYVVGFGKSLGGAIASSVGHDSHNLIGVGNLPEDRRVAFRWLAEQGGGFCVVRSGQVIEGLPLPIAGLMSDRSNSDVAHALAKLRIACHAIGCELPEPFLQLAFLSLPVIPSLKLTDRGLFDVNRFELISLLAG